ncbi:stage V sporulation protein AA [Agathobacter sp.]
MEKEKPENILIYIRAEKQKTVYRRQVCINDICNVYCKYSRYEGEIKGTIVNTIRGKKSVIPVIDIIEKITEQIDNAQVISIGSPEVLVEYDDNKKNKILEALKVAAVCILIFFGSAFTIMAFNNDISINDMFEHFYTQIMGKEKPQVSVLEIFYCIGLALGIVLFFNHIGKKKLSDDVTPIQVEMDKHNKDTWDTIIDKVKEKQDV